MRGTCVGVLVGLAVLTVGCSGSSTGEDARRAELLDTDPLFTTELDGVRWETSAVAGPGSGPGPGTYWTEAFRWGRVAGDPREVLFDASGTARRLGWTITEVECFPGSGYLVRGWRQFDRFVANLSISWSDFPGRDRDRIFLKAQTPPVKGGSKTNSPPPRSWQVDLARTCLAKGQGGDENR